ncbi:MAG TPA: Gfo/Idh/MocA family oxidoreductase [Burkholderiales bacterium]|nr:Gfo/Idh/MocA family oxidoreductase [Burkholderiales bacterium]
MLQIALIGAGQLGSRHLQALALFDRATRVMVVDPAESALATARERFAQVKQSRVEAVFTRNFGDLPKDLDGAVVATGANVRRRAIEALLQQSRVKVALLEKVLFQKIEDYAAVGALLEKSSTRAWVNCAQRLWPFFSELRPRTLGKPGLQLTVSGANWGLGCNAIHNLDLLSFLTGDADCRIESALDAGSIPSKRQGFIEFTGTLYAFGASGSRVIQSSYRDGAAPFIFELQNEDFHAIWRVTEGVMQIADAGSEWKWRERSCQALYQSQLTHRVLAEMLGQGRSALPTYVESAALHLSMLGVFLRHLGPGAQSCDIT